MTLSEDFLLHHITEELKDKFEGLRTERIKLNIRRGLVLGFSGCIENLIISIDNTYPSIYSAKKIYFEKDLSYSNDLSSYLEGAILSKIKKIEDDRTIHLTFKKNNEIFNLYFECRPISTSVIFCSSSGKVEFKSGYKKIAQHTYKPSKRSHRINPLDGNFEKQFLSEGFEDRASMLKGISYLSPTLLDEAEYLASNVEDVSIGSCIKSVVEKAYSLPLGFYLYSKYEFKEGSFRNHPFKDLTISTFPLQHRRQWYMKEFETLNSIFTTLSSYCVEWRKFNSLKGEGISSLKAKLHRLEKKRFSLSEELKKAISAEQFRKNAELILANMHIYGADYHSSRIEVPNLYSDTNSRVQIRLNEKLTLKENADLLFKKYRKIKQSRKTIPPLLKQTEKKIQEERLLLSKVEGCYDLSSLKKLNKAIPAKQSAAARFVLKNKQGSQRIVFRHFKTSTGLTILVGKNARENDLLTFKVASANDFWFHVRDWPGPHVVLVWGKKGNPPEKDLLEAASVAAYFSAASGERVVDVYCTRRRYIQKIKGKAGLVRVLKSRTLLVEPRIPQNEDS